MSAVSSSSSKETDDHTSQVIAQNDEVFIQDNPVEDINNIIPVNVIDGVNIDDDIKAGGAPIGGRMLQENENTEQDIESVHSIQLSSEEQTTTKHILDRDEGNEHLEDSVLDRSETNRFVEPVILHNNPNNVIPGDEGNIHDSVLDMSETNRFVEPVILHNNPNNVIPGDEGNIHDSVLDMSETNRFVEPVILHNNPNNVIPGDEGNIHDSVLDMSETNRFAEPVVLHNNPNNDEGNVRLDGSILDKREIDSTNQFTEPVILHNNPNNVPPADEGNVHLDDSILHKREIDSTNQFVKPVILPLDQNDREKSTEEQINELDQEKEFLDFHDSIPENPPEGLNLETHRDTSNDIITPHVLFNEEQDPVLQRKEQDIPNPVLQEDTMETDNKENKQSSKINIDKQPISVNENNPTVQQLGHDL